MVQFTSDSHIQAGSRAESRATFIRSVYLWLMAGFGVATLAALASWETAPQWKALARATGRLFPWILFGAQMGTILFAQSVSRRRPLNMLAYALFTSVSGFIAGIISLAMAQAGGGQVVLSALGMTAGVFLLLTATAVFSKKDFSFLRSFVVVGIGIMFFGGLIAALFHLPLFSMVISAVAVLACSAKLLWDTSTLLRTEDHSDPAGFALALFVSLYNIFISLLHLLGGRRD